MSFYKIIRPLVFSISPENAHNLAIKTLKSRLVPPAKIKQSSKLEVDILGMKFSNPLGLAAGFDKNAEVIKPILKQGFGFVEVGTCTPHPQEGNPQPRLFRLIRDKAVINRMGFNNDGAELFVNNLTKRPKKSIIGANIGKNKTTPSALNDYLYMLESVYGFCEYITINISSPNTVGLRDLQQKNALDDLLKNLIKKRDQLSKEKGFRKPLLLKIAPDNTLEQLEDIAYISTENKIDGLIISNTTIKRPESLKSHNSNQTGGLSGKPLLNDSTEVLRYVYSITKGRIPIIGVGGISNAKDAYQKIKAGASLLQIYSVLVYEGFSVVNKILNELELLLEKEGFDNIQEAVGVEAKIS